MTSRDFAYWLQGFFEMTDSKELTIEQVHMIKRHLKLVFFYDKTDLTSSGKTDSSGFSGSCGSSGLSPAIGNEATCGRSFLPHFCNTSSNQDFC